VLYDIRQIVAGAKIDVNMEGSICYRESLFSNGSNETTILQTHCFFKDPSKATESFKAMSPAELAQAETLFANFNLAKAPGLTVSRFGFDGEITGKQIGLRKGQLANLTKARLQNQIANANKAIQGLGGG
jgi:hypothetical protein